MVSGFEDPGAGQRWLRHASVDNFHALLDEKTGRAAQLEVVSLAEINKRKGLTQTWRDAEETRAAEIAAAEAEAKRLAEEKVAAEAAAAREAEIKRLVIEKAQAEQQARFAKLREEVEEELATQAPARTLSEGCRLEENGSEV